MSPPNLVQSVAKVASVNVNKKYWENTKKFCSE